MIYKCLYNTPAGFSNMIMNSDGENLTGLWFENSRDSSKHIINCKEQDLEIFRETRRWLDIYFSGRNPDFIPKYKIENLTPFRQAVIDIMNSTKFGQTLTYNAIAKIIAKKRGLKKMSAQAVGGAVGWNPICIIIPCHRVVGANGNLTGYGGGIQNKVALLELENNNMKNYFIPKQGTALWKYVAGVIWEYIISDRTRIFIKCKYYSLIILISKRWILLNPLNNYFSHKVTILKIRYVSVTNEGGIYEKCNWS